MNYAKTEEALREAEIIDAVCADVDLAVKAYRRRMLAAIGPAVLKDFRDQVAAGSMPAIDAAYRERIRATVVEKAAALESGS